MKIYKISQNSNNDYDTYDSAIVVAKDEEQAKRIHPNESNTWKEGIGWIDWNGKPDKHQYEWVDDINEVSVEFIGIASKEFKESKVILASFNAG